MTKNLMKICLFDSSRNSIRNANLIFKIGNVAVLDDHRTLNYLYFLIIEYRYHDSKWKISA